MIIKDRMCYSQLLELMQEPAFVRSVHKTTFNKPDVPGTGFNGYIEVDVEFEVGSLKEFQRAMERTYASPSDKAKVFWHYLNRLEKEKEPDERAPLCVIQGVMAFEGAECYVLFDSWVKGKISQCPVKANPKGAIVEGNRVVNFTYFNGENKTRQVNANCLFWEPTPLGFVCEGDQPGGKFR